MTGVINRATPNCLRNRAWGCQLNDITILTMDWVTEVRREGREMISSKLDNLPPRHYYEGTGSIYQSQGPDEAEREDLEY